MSNFEVKTALRGLARADGSRDAVPVGAVILMSDDAAITRSLIALGAIVPTQADVTCGLISEIGIGGDVQPRGADIAALSLKGAIIFFPGEGLPDGAELVLADFSNDQLLDEIEARIAGVRLSPTLLSELIDISSDAAGDLNIAAGDGTGKTLPPVVGDPAEIRDSADTGAADLVESQPVAPATDVAPVKPTRKKASS